jgi:DNA-binding transcriptional LysR family regulator
MHSLAEGDATTASMNIRRLQHLVVLADEGSFRRAAAKVHLSQPAFSRSIQAAEAELGLKLFDRGPIEAKATPAGAFVVERARRLLQQTRNLERDVSLYREHAVGDFSFGCAPFAAASLVPALLADLRARYPDVAVCVHVSNLQHLIGGVRSEEQDFFIGGIADVPAGGVFRVERVGRVPIGAYVRHGHPLLGRRKVVAAELLPFGLAGARLPRETAARLSKAMGLAPDGKPPIAVECEDIHLLQRVALDSDTVVVGSAALLAEPLQRRQVHEIVLADLPRQHWPLGIVSLEGRTPSPVTAYAMRFLAQAAKARAAA